MAGGALDNDAGGRCCRATPPKHSGLVRSVRDHRWPTSGMLRIQRLPRHRRMQRAVRGCPRRGGFGGCLPAALTGDAAAADPVFTSHANRPSALTVVDDAAYDYRRM